jgi:hypothetical protein
MGLPAGLRPNNGGYELVPAGEPLVHRMFMKDIGPRAILVGSPDGVHVAFDAGAVRMAKAWHGRFVDAAKSRRDRGGTPGEPLGTDVIDLPPGPSFAVLPSPNTPWPTGKAGERNVGGRFKGYHTDKAGQPTFTYKLGDVDIEETPVAALRKDGAALVRKFSVKSDKPAPGLTFLAAAGQSVESVGVDTWKVDGKLTVHIDAKLRPIVRQDAGVRQLVIPIANTPAGFEVEMTW